VNYSRQAVYAIDTTFVVDDRFTRADIRWLYYLLSSLSLDQISRDSAIPGLDREQAYEQVAACPSARSEQLAIVQYLDCSGRATERVVRQKNRLITLLNEQKQAIIHRAVTRGLDPNVRLKPSRVEWLGKVPEHWDVAPLRLRYLQCLGKMLDTKRIKGSHLVPYLRNVDVQWDRVATTELPSMDITATEFDRYTLRKGDLLVCEGGEVGRAAIWNGDLPICGFQKAIHRLRPVSVQRDLPRFLMYVLRAAARAGAFDDGHESTIAHLTGEKIRSHRLAFPELREQIEIVEHLDAATRRVDGAIQAIRGSIEVCIELRTRLIADVVTGKVDVRQAARLSEIEESEEPLDASDAPADVEAEHGLDADADNAESDDALEDAVA
jgi:type I restriction enzyme S subunit